MRRIGERLYFTIETGDTGSPGYVWPKDPAPTASLVYSTGLCGEEPMKVADDIWRVFEVEQLPGVVLGCRGKNEHDLVALDPAGGEEPTLWIRRGCFAIPTAHGFVRDESYSEGTTRALFYPYPDDVTAGLIGSIVLLEKEETSYLGVFADEVLALDHAGDIVRVSLPDGDVSVVQGGALAFEATERWLLWFDRAGADGDPEDPTADVMLRDRETGDDMFLARRKIGSTRPMLRDDRVLITGKDDETLLFDLELHRSIPVPEGHYPWNRLADGRWLTGTDFRAAPYYLLDPDGTATLLTTDDGVTGRGPEGLYILHVERLPTGGFARDEGELWRHPYDGREPELIAQRANWRHVLRSDGGVITTLGVGAQWTGELVVVEPGTLAERTIDEHVNLTVLVDEETFGPDALVYAVRDGERSGVWVSRLAAE